MSTVKLDQDAARAWLVAQQNAEDASDVVLDDDWDPREVGEEPTIYRLVCESQQVSGVWTKPEGISDLAYVYDADSDGGGYYFTVDVLMPGERSTALGLRLAGTWSEMRKIGDFEKRGIDAAISILQEVEADVNYELRKLAAYVRAVLAAVEAARPTPVDKVGNPKDGRDGYVSCDGRTPPVYLSSAQVDGASLYWYGCGEAHPEVVGNDVADCGIDLCHGRPGDDRSIPNTPTKETS